MWGGLGWEEIIHADEMGAFEQKTVTDANENFQYYKNYLCVMVGYTSKSKP